MRRKLILVGLALTSLPVSLTSQTPAAPNPIVEKIRAIGMDSSSTERLAHQLFDSIGPRLTGSPDAKRGNDWLVQTYKSWGINARESRSSGDGGSGSSQCREGKPRPAD
jgi:carboxypeptidase Q